MPTTVLRAPPRIFRPCDGPGINYPSTPQSHLLSLISVSDTLYSNVIGHR
jgi:hypothetical protein